MKLDFTRLKTLCNILIFSCLSLNVKAQTIHQQAYWTRAFAKIKLDSNWTLQAEVDERRLILPDKQ